MCLVGVPKGSKEELVEYIHTTELEEKWKVIDLDLIHMFEFIVIQYSIKTEFKKEKENT
jgi:hypothetical protein